MSLISRRFFASTVAFATVISLVACSSDNDSTSTEAPTTLAPLPLATYTVRPGAHQIAVIDAEPGTDRGEVAVDDPELVSQIVAVIKILLKGYLAVYMGKPVHSD